MSYRIRAGLRRAALVLAVGASGAVADGVAAAAATSPTTAPAAPVAAGVRCEIWYHTPPGQVEDALTDPALRRPPDEVQSLADSAFLPPQQVPFVAAMRGWIHPPASGDYRFALSSDDTGLLLLSGDDGPAGLKPVASAPEWSPVDQFGYYDSQRSSPIHLDAGKRYLFESVVQNVDGAGHLQVAWIPPGGKAFVTIPGSAVEPLPGGAPLWVSPPRRPTSLVLAPDPGDAGHVAGFHPYVNGATAHFDDGEHVTFSYLLFTPGPGATSQPVTQPSTQASTTGESSTSDGLPSAEPTPRGLFVFLHGSGHQGSSLAGILNEGPAKFLAQSRELRQWFPMEALFPELPDGMRWDTPGAAAAVNALVRAICDRYPEIDRRRIYVSGLSMGGKGTWLTAFDAPQLYAGVATFSAVAVRPSTAPRVLGDLPYLHIVCGADDGDFTRGSTLMNSVLAPVLGDRLTFDCVPHRGHGVWLQFYGTQAFYADLLRHRRADLSGH